jgi:uncharacterized protein YbbK (DUF523 family)
MKTPCLISACLLGVRCRYDATHSALNGDLLKMLMESHVLVPVCPEQMGGLSTPRVPVQFEGGDGIALLEGRARMLNLKGEDLTLQFMEGAQEVLKLARILGIKKAVLKDKSPSCGVKMVYIADELKEGVGVTTALLIREGLKISAEGEL